MKQQTVTLKIVYDELQNEPPAQWLWPVLLDMGGAESVEIIGATPIENFTDENHEEEEDNN